MGGDGRRDIPHRHRRVQDVVLLEQVRTLDKRRLKEKMGELPEEAMHSVDSALSISFGLGPRPGRHPETHGTT